MTIRSTCSSLRTRVEWAPAGPSSKRATNAEDFIPKLEPKPRLPLKPDLPKERSPASFETGLHNSGDVLLSHRASPAVPSALIGLTSEFGMGSGVTLPTLPPNA
jgi:hypothetical protein